MARKKKGRSRSHKNILGGRGKIPVMATISMLGPITEEIDAWKGGAGVSGLIYHPTGYNMTDNSWNARQVYEFWKLPVAGALGSMIAQKVGANRITSKIPIVGKFLRF